MTTRFLLILGLFAMACGGGDEPKDVEGDSAGECSDGADNDRDGRFDCDDSDCANAPACNCTDACGPEGIRLCAEDVAQSCELNANGCLELVDEDCAANSQHCIGGACVAAPGLCSATGESCADDGDCPATEITGFCIDGPGGWFCGYDTRIDTGSNVTCEAQTVGRCQSPADCPGEPQCRTLAADYCGSIADGICALTKMACAADTECSITPANTCAICGDGIKVVPAEECDDGNTADDDGCSADCRYEGVCAGRITHSIFDGCGCSTYADCATNYDSSCEMSCAMETGCYCTRRL